MKRPFRNRTLPRVVLVACTCTAWSGAASARDVAVKQTTVAGQESGAVPLDVLERNVDAFVASRRKQQGR